jgi:hypothetical protein
VKKRHNILTSSWSQRDNNALLSLFMFCVLSQQLALINDSTEFIVLLQNLHKKKKSIGLLCMLAVVK